MSVHVVYTLALDITIPSLTLLLMVFLRMCGSQWIQSNSTLPFPSRCMAIGSYNNSIYILGGMDSSWGLRSSLVLYNINNGHFVTYDPYLPTAISVYGYSTYYTQIQNILYVIVFEEAVNNYHILSYNMQTKGINYTYATIPIGFAKKYKVSPCLASNANYLFVTGGKNATDAQEMTTVQVYDISSGQWLSNVPSMDNARTAHTCVVHPITNYLYVIAGKTDTIEYINTTNIEQQQWSPFGQSFTGKRRDLRSVYFDNIIYVIGGHTDSWTSGPYFNTVYMIHPESQQLTVSPHNLSYGIALFVSIMVNQRLYVFGGAHGGVEVDTWMYYDFETAQPTNSPLSLPSAVPSTAPTNVTSVFLKSSHATLNVSNIATSGVDISGVVKPLLDKNTQFILIVTVGSILFCIIIVCAWYCIPKDVQKLRINVNHVMFRSSGHEVNHDKDNESDKNVKMVENDANARQFKMIELELTDIRLKNTNALQMQYWLNNVVQLPFYYDIFMQNGFESLQIMKGISNVTVLEEIGITDEEHQKKILEEIEELKYGDYGGNHNVSVGEDTVDVVMRTVEGNADYRGENRKGEATKRNHNIGDDEFIVIGNDEITKGNTDRDHHIPRGN